MVVCLRYPPFYKSNPHAQSTKSGESWNEVKYATCTCIVWAPLLGKRRSHLFVHSKWLTWSEEHINYSTIHENWIQLSKLTPTIIKEGTPDLKQRFVAALQWDIHCMRQLTWIPTSGLACIVNISYRKEEGCQGLTWPYLCVGILELWTAQSSV